MKNILIGAISYLALIPGIISAQTLKFGHIDFQMVLLKMPEKISADSALSKMTAEFQTELTKMQKNLTDKSKEYMSQQNTLTDAVRASKEAELNSLNRIVQNFPQQAQENISKEETRLIQPVVEKLRKTISDVAKERGLLYVFDINNLIYHSEQSIDITDPVKAKLGIK